MSRAALFQATIMALGMIVGLIILSARLEDARTENAVLRAKLEGKCGAGKS